MAVDAAALALALGVPNAEGARLLPLATALVAAYLHGGEAPAVIYDEAIIRTAGHVRARSPAHMSDGGRVKTSGTQIDVTAGARSPVRASGAAALLAPWVRRTA